MNKSFFNKNINIISPKIYHDIRGFFFESYNLENIKKKLNKKINFVQDNISFSKRGIFRGLHFQNNNYAQFKALQVLDGIIIDVIVDIRHNSSTFGKHIKYKLDSKNRESIFIEKGFAHGFLTLSKTALIMYKVDNYYSKKNSYALDYLDPKLNLNLSKYIKQKITISDQDKKGLTLNEVFLMKIK